MLDIEALYNVNCSCVYWTAYAIMRDGDKAKDAAQEVFLKALKHQATLRRLTQLQRKLWLCTAARNECIDTLRKLKREYLIDPQLLHVPEDELRPTICCCARKSTTRCSRCWTPCRTNTERLCSCTISQKSLKRKSPPYWE